MQHKTVQKSAPSTIWKRRVREIVYREFLRRNYTDF